MIRRTFQSSPGSFDAEKHEPKPLTGDMKMEEVPPPNIQEIKPEDVGDADAVMQGHSRKIV